jgi:hypothetical protein
MAIRFSTKLRNMLLGAVPVVTPGGASLAAATIAWVGGAPDKLHISAGSFITQGFAVGDVIMVSGFTTAVNNGIFTVTVVEDSDLSVSETTAETEAEGNNVKIQVISGGSLKDIFLNGVLKIYSGTQPANADAAYGSTLLCTISTASGTFTAGAPDAGLRFGTAASGAISKASSVWSGVVATTGTAGWFRLMGNVSDASGLDSTYLYPRIDGSIGTSGADLNMGSTSLTAAATLTIDTFTVTLPAE